LKTTLEIPDQLFREAKAKAALEGRRLTDLITEGLQLVVNRPREAQGKRLKFPLLKSKRKEPLAIPDDIAGRVELVEDLRRYEKSMR
jgi:hypothetical protein